jgi:hypothetical protein
MGLGVNLNSSGGIEKPNSLGGSSGEALKSEDVNAQLVYARIVGKKGDMGISSNSSISNVSIRPKLDLVDILENRALVMNKNIPLIQLIKEGLKTPRGGKSVTPQKPLGSSK